MFRSLITGPQARNKGLEDELAALKKSYHSVDDKRQFYRKVNMSVHCIFCVPG